MQQNHSAKEISLVSFKFKHLPMLVGMLEDNDSPDATRVNMKNLPKIGYIAILSNQPIAVGFLRRLEGNYAQMDTLVSNPYFGSKIRHDGINLVVNSLIGDAKELKLDGIIAFTKDQGVLDRAKSIGFQVLEQTLISLPIVD